MKKFLKSLWQDKWGGVGYYLMAKGGFDASFLEIIIGLLCLKEQEYQDGRRASKQTKRRGRK